MREPKPVVESPASRRAVEGLRGHYRSGEHDLARDFFKPCMAYCNSYRRAAGFFSSSSLVTWAEALPRFVQLDEIEIKLLISPQLTDEDYNTLEQVADEPHRKRLLQRLGERVVLDALEFARDPENPDLRMRLFAWLVATERLTLRFAFPRHVPNPGIYHEKLGIFEFPGGECIAFTGSANETISGHSLNYESVDVFRSWVPGDAERVAIKTAQFEEIWSERAEGIDVVPLSEEVLRRIRRNAPRERPDVTGRSPSGSKASGVKADARWRHQDEAISRFLDRERGVLEMATGTGKTRTALKIAQRLVDAGEIRTIIVAADGTDLLNQWQGELLGLIGRLPVKFSLHRHFSRHRERERYRLNPEASILLSSRQALAPALRGLDPVIAQQALLVHDEVHRLGSPGNRSELAGLSELIRFRVGLSATPEREYDEVGTAFIEEHIGPVIFEFTLADAIRRGILAPFDYHPLPYEPSDEDRERIAQVFRRQAAREAAGDPMREEELWIALAHVHKTSAAKLPVFDTFIGDHKDLLTRCIIFVETREYGERVLDIVHRYRHDFHTYFAAEDSDVLRRFARGDLECLLTCHRLSEGIDIQNLRSVVLFSSARSRLETIQRIGRCLRRDPDDPQKQAQVVDFVRAEESEGTNPDQERAAWLEEMAAVEPEE